MNLESKALVKIERAARYGKQLASHLSHKSESSEIAGGWQLTMTIGIATITADEDLLTMTAKAENTADLERIQFVLDKHLKQFTTKLPEFEIVWVQP
jgi:hypothetical protein